MEKVNNKFSYAEFTTRNIGFVSEAEQISLSDKTVFICGVGGMGGACVHTLARTGISGFIIADIDEFEVSNLNRQVFATMDTIGVDKAEVTAAAIATINPEAKITVYKADWEENLEAILGKADLVINGMDDIPATIKLYRKCRAQGRTVIDAYAASLPSVYITRPGDQTPEERLGYTTAGKEVSDWTDDDLSGAFLRELEHVMACSSSRKYIDMTAGAEVAAGIRSRMSFATMVILTGNLMAYEAVNFLLGKTSGADNQGYFFNPYSGRTEHPPLKPFAWLKRRIARRLIASLMAKST